MRCVRCWLQVAHPHSLGWVQVCIHHTDVPTCLAPQDLLDEFLKLFDFSEMSLDEALR